MNDPTVQQRTVPSHVRERRRDILFALVALGLGVVSTVIIGAIVNGERRYETNRADDAIVALEQACAQVERLGGHCATKPAQIEGDTRPASVPGPPGPSGIDGPPGRPPTEAEIAAAVSAYLLANPVPAGQPGQQGDAGPSCPTGWHLAVLTVRLAGGNQSAQITACIQD